MLRIAILSPAGPDLAELFKVLKQRGRFDLRTFMTLAECDHGLRPFAPHALVIRLPRFDLSTVARIQKMRQAFPKASLLICSPDIEEQARFSLVNETRLSLLDPKQELRELPEIIQRFQNEAFAHSRAHLRTARSEAVEIKTTHGDVIAGRFIDFGRMGARVQLEPHSLTLRDRVLLSYESSTAQKTRKIEAVVVWQKDTEPHLRVLPHARTAGIKFIAYV